MMSLSESSAASPEAIYKTATLRPLIARTEIDQRIGVLAQSINQDYADRDKLIVIGVLKGAVLFMADLIRQVNIPCHLEFVRLSSYGNHSKSSGTVKPVDLSLPNLEGQDVLVVEDIVDTGLTMQFLVDYLQSVHQVRSVRVAVLLDKHDARLPEAKALPLDYVGFPIGNEFVVGYGLDYAGYYRNLPDICILEGV